MAPSQPIGSSPLVPDKAKKSITSVTMLSGIMPVAVKTKSHDGPSDYNSNNNHQQVGNNRLSRRSNSQPTLEQAGDNKARRNIKKVEGSVPSRDAGKRRRSFDFITSLLLDDEIHDVPQHHHQQAQHRASDVKLHYDKDPSEPPPPPRRNSSSSTATEDPHTSEDEEVKKARPRRKKESTDNSGRSDRRRRDNEGKRSGRQQQQRSPSGGPSIPSQPPQRRNRSADAASQIMHLYPQQDLGQRRRSHHERAPDLFNHSDTLLDASGFDAMLYDDSPLHASTSKLHGKSSSKTSSHSSSSSRHHHHHHHGEGGKNSRKSKHKDKAASNKVWSINEVANKKHQHAAHPYPAVRNSSKRGQASGGIMGDEGNNLKEKGGRGKSSPHPVRGFVDPSTTLKPPPPLAPIKRQSSCDPPEGGQPRPGGGLKSSQHGRGGMSNHPTPPAPAGLDSLHMHHHNNNNPLKSSMTGDCSVETIHTIDDSLAEAKNQTAAELRDLIEMMQAEFHKLRSAKVNAEMRATTLETDLVASQEERDMQVMQLSEEMERWKRMAHQQKVRYEGAQSKVERLEDENHNMSLQWSTVMKGKMDAEERCEALEGENCRLRKLLKGMGSRGGNGNNSNSRDRSGSLGVAERGVGSSGHHHHKENNNNRDVSSFDESTSHDDGSLSVTSSNICSPIPRTSSRGGGGGGGGEVFHTPPGSPATADGLSMDQDHHNLSLYTRMPFPTAGGKHDKNDDDAIRAPASWHAGKKKKKKSILKNIPMGMPFPTAAGGSSDDAAAAVAGPPARSNYHHSSSGGGGSFHRKSSSGKSKSSSRRSGRGDDRSRHNSARSLDGMVVLMEAMMDKEDLGVDESARSGPL